MTERTIFADLHNHSQASDGEYTSSELIAKSHALNLGAIALTDHDTVNGVAEALAAGKKYGITVIPGMELTICFKRPFFTGSLHLLLYFHENKLNDKLFRKDLDALIQKGRGGNLVTARVSAINREFGPKGHTPYLKHPLTVDTVMQHGQNITRRHFFLALSKDHQITDKETINSIIGNQSPAYIPSGVDVTELHHFLQSHRLIKIIAHPAAGSFEGEGHYKEVLPPYAIMERLLPEFLDPDIIGIDGIEIYYPGHSTPYRHKLLELAEREKLLITGGSDCHDSKDRPLGVAGITAAEFEAFMVRYNAL